MKPVLRSSLDTAGPTTSMRRCVYSSPERVVTFLSAACCSALAARLLLDADQHVGGRAEALDLHGAEAELVELARAARAMSAGPDLDCTSISEPPLKSTP